MKVEQYEDGSVRIECQGTVLVVSQVHPTDNEGIQVRMDQPAFKSMAVLPKVANVIVIKPVHRG